MIKLIDGKDVGDLWIGDSRDEEHARLELFSITGVLNVAQDMPSTRSWKKGVIEVMQVGLMDGPGNETATYVSAILALHTMISRHNTLICCHSTSRSLAITIAYLITKAGRSYHHATIMGCWKTWDNVLTELMERTGVVLPKPHDAHRRAIDVLPFELIERLM